MATLDAPLGPWTHAFAQAAGDVRLHYVHAGPVDGLPVVLVHGWPDLWFGWRHQIKALEATQAYRVIVPDLRGFGQSSTPVEIEKYGAKNIADDLAALLDALDIDKAVFIGHDWGGAMVWRMCLYHPERVLAVCGVCTPYKPPSTHYVDLDGVVQYLPAFEYHRFLADTATAASYLNTSPRRLFTALFRRYNEGLPRDQRRLLSDILKGVKDSDDRLYTQRSTLLTEDEFEYYVQQYTQTGFQSNCAYYATRKIDFDNELGLPEVLPMPALYIGAAKDAILTPAMALKMPEVIPNLEMKVVENSGHWVLWEQTEEVNAILLAWLHRIKTQHPLGGAKL
ncbi:hypothetical protein P43SY_007406 [Pythium insidiosum]|uniref:AB hydrolase-1 domain-containing protein n=1 Tax=Pythium insidiosum TaxID=114742 RepID=A0AAD5LF43_PYTIN|nr:hypothetical protein P43SY_007406 [Pythium insidiosum]